ncbi:MAG: sugar-binding transcriptional regulator [Spirochaetia bacterium]
MDHRAPADRVSRSAERRRLLVEVAKLYYYEDLSQQEIARRIGLSRSNVSKMLQSCKELGIVEVHVNEHSFRGREYAEELKHRFALEYIEVIPSSDITDPEVLKDDLGKAAARYIERRLDTVKTFGLSWGSTLYYLVEHLDPAPPLHVDVIQLMGGVGPRDLSVDGLQLAYRLAHKLGGTCTVIHAPLFVQNLEAKKILLEEPEIVRALDAAENVEIAVLGIGSSYPESSALIRAGYVSKQEMEILLKRGAVGNILGRHIMSSGELCDIEMNDRVIGLATEKLDRIELKIGLAGGKDKAEAILGCLRGGFINGLVTDESAAARILSMLYAEEEI